MAPKPLAAMLAIVLTAPALADERDDLLKLRQDIAKAHEELTQLKNTTENLIDLFVGQGLLDKQKAEALLQAARAKAALPKSGAEPGGSADHAETDANKPQRIRVAYVPEFVKEEIRQEVMAGLQDKVVAQVKADAKEEKWGIPAALPAWLDRIKITADARLRLQNNSFGDDNKPYLDYLSINRDGGVLAALNRNEAFLNTTVDRFRFTERFRLGLEAMISDGLSAGLRLSTTNELSPVSSNQTLGNTGRAYQVALDRAFVQYNFLDAQSNDWFSLYGGRIANPWFSTDMKFSADLSFEGFAGAFRWRMNQDDPLLKRYRAPEATRRYGLQMGPQTPDSLFLTLGVFPIQEVTFSTADKWLFAGQVGADWLVHNDSRLKLAAAFYHYENIRARANRRDSFANDWTAPQFLVKGNTMVPINVNDGFNSRCTGSQSLRGQGCLFGLASDFRIFNATAFYDFADFAPVHALLSLDYAKNLGYDAGRIAREFPGFFTGEPGADNKDRTNAFQIRLDVGHEEIRHFMDWAAIVGFRYIQRDAVLDAFTDAFFHQGGTDGQGWMVGGNYGLAKNTSVLLRWFSTQAIDGPTLDIDMLTLDLNLRL